jgi:pilus assembly protein CpaC
MADKPDAVINLLELPHLTIEQLRESLGATEPGTQETGPMGISPAALAPPTAGGMAGALRPTVRPFINVREVGDQVILEGVVLTAAQAADAAEVAARTGLRVVNRLQVAPAPAEGVAFLNSIAAAIGRPGITVRGTAQRLVLEGTVANTNEAVAVEQIARAFSPNVDNMLMTPDPQMVDVDVAIYEINRTKLNRLGVTYTSLLDGAANPIGFVLSEPTATGVPGLITDNAGPNINGPGFRTRSPFQASLRALVENNDARLLSNPHTTVLSSRTATFQVGGQVPIPGSSTVTNAGATTEIVFKDYGILVDVVPVASKSGAITMRVRTEVSQPDFTIGVTPPGGGSLIPGFSRRATVTEVTVPPNGAIALAGLIQHNVTELVRKLPILGDIPVLGKLFRSKRFQRNETELVMFVTPRVLPNTMPPGTLVPAAVFAAGNTSNQGAILGNPGINVFNGGGVATIAGAGASAGGSSAGGTP